MLQRSGTEHSQTQIQAFPFVPFSPLFSHTGSSTNCLDPSLSPICSFPETSYRKSCAVSEGSYRHPMHLWAIAFFAGQTGRVSQFPTKAHAVTQGLYDHLPPQQCPLSHSVPQSSHIKQIFGTRIAFNFLSNSYNPLDRLPC